jgi:hypothetical protein
MKKLTITQRDGTKHVVRYDDCDADIVKNHTWHVTAETGGEGSPIYARTFVKGKAVTMHSLIAGKHPKHVVIMHVNNDSLDNRRINLRWVDNATAIRNQKRRVICMSGVPGVYPVRSRDLWSATYLDKNHKRIRVGYAKTVQEAVAKIEAHKARHS